MLNTAFRRAAYESAANPVSEVTPWMIQVSPSVILNKDGGLLACFEVGGADLEGLEQIHIDQLVNVLEHAMRLFDERITIWWTVDRRRTTAYPDGGHFADPVSAYIDDEWRKRFNSGAQYENKHYLSVLFSPETGTGRFVELLESATMEGRSLPSAAFFAARAMLSKSAAYREIMRQLDRNLKRFSDLLSSFEQTASDARMRRLMDSDLLCFLHDKVSPASYGQPVKPPPIPAYLDGYLGDNTIHVGHDLLAFHHNTPCYVSASSVKDWPTASFPGLLDGVLSIPAEITISQCFRFVAQGEAKSYIEKVRKHNLNAQKSGITYLSEALTNKESDRVNEGAVLAAQDAGEALTSITTAARAFGYYNLTILSYGPNRETCEDSMKLITKVLNNQGFISVRESLHLLSAWAGTLPGQWQELVRWSFISSGNIADMAPIRTISPGPLTNDYLTEQTGRHCPSLTVLDTEYSVPFYFNFHNGDLAHAMVVGPSRSGKSIFLNFLTSQFRKYGPCRVFIFDKDYSCRIPTLLQGGRHIDMSGDAPDVKMNPMKLVGDKAAWPWLSRWVELLLSSRGYEFKAKDDHAVHSALESVAGLQEDKWILRSLHSHFRAEMGEQLQQWIGTGANAKYFDNDADTFDLGDFTCIEMGGLFHNPRVASAFIDYAFYRISRSLDGTPTMIYIEEFWFMLADDRFRARINDWLRTLAKKNAFIVFATQSLEEIATSDIFATLIDNIPNRIFLPNPNAYAHIDLYTKKFALNQTQVERIRTAIPKQQYYISTPSMTRMAVASFPREILACLRSDSRAQDVFKRHYGDRDVNPHWKESYVREMLA